MMYDQQKYCLSCCNLTIIMYYEPNFVDYNYTLISALVHGY